MEGKRNDSRRRLYQDSRFVDYLSALEWRKVNEFEENEEKIAPLAEQTKLLWSRIVYYSSIHYKITWESFEKPGGFGAALILKAEITELLKLLQ